MRYHNKNGKQITSAKCSECGQEKATAFFRAKPVCQKCYERLRKPIPIGNPYFYERMLKIQKGIQNE